MEIVLSDETHRRNSDLPEQWIARAVRYQRPGYPLQLLLTSMLAARKYPAREIAALYHERWELELGYDEVMSEMLDREEALRSPSPRGVAPHPRLLVPRRSHRELRGDISRFILPFPRAVKIKMSNYPRKRPLAEAA